MNPNTLKLLRNYHSCTQVEIAENLGISDSSLSLLERGLRASSLKLLEKYGELLGYTVLEILAIDEALQKPNPQEAAKALPFGKLRDFLVWTRCKGTPLKTPSPEEDLPLIEHIEEKTL